MSEEEIVTIRTKRPKKAKKRLAKLSRWLHIYLSMASFVIVLFFSVTGLTLNHPDLFQGKAVTTQDKGTVNRQWVNSPDTNRIARLDIAEFFRNQYKVKGAVTDFRIDDSQVSLSFRGPGYEADAFITRSSGAFELTQTRSGIVAFMNDLHKGRDTGQAWSRVIDIAAILLVLISLTGLILLLFLKKKRRNGLVLAIAGGLIIYLLYHIWGQ